MNNTIIRPSRRNRYAAPIGGVFIILCLVGFFTVASVCLNATKSLLDNSKAKQEYERMLLPVVIFDPVPFETPACCSIPSGPPPWGTKGTSMNTTTTT